MSGELKKEFSKKEVTRMRNIIKGKTGSQTTTQVGYKKNQKHYKEGDIWEEDGRKWTIKEGLKQNITKHDKAKKAHIMPLLCPTCNNVMKKRNDKIFYKIHKMCFDCVNIMESRMMSKGTFKDYERKIKNDELDNMINDFKLFIENKLEEGSQGYVAENGDIERWIGKIDTERVDDYVKDTIAYLEGLKE
tara:strand:+ start:568 stop:1137 length:570 start_codon:yes stop_codon:yes gene_type:complete